MVEMLMAAFIMAVGLLGLAMLQTYSMRAQAGSSNQGVAVQLGEQILDEAENLGRNSVMCAHNGFTVPAPATNYLGAAPVVQTFTNTGVAGAPVFFTATSTATLAASPGVVTAVSQIGGIAMVQVVVSWSETLSTTGGALPRTVTLYRRIEYATN
jgi:Tfp pilus assembly protein PilV